MCPKTRMRITKGTKKNKAQNIREKEKTKKKRKNKKQNQRKEEKRDKKWKVEKTKTKNKKNRLRVYKFTVYALQTKIHTEGPINGITDIRLTITVALQYDICLYGRT